MRAARLTLASAALLLLSTPPAVSAPPAPGGAPSMDPIIFAAGERCPFPIAITVRDNSAVRHELPSGILIISGQVRATVTNMETDASRAYNISGPVTFDPATNRVVMVGSSLIGAPPDIGGPFLIVTSGRVSFIDGQPIDQPLRGHVRHDVCADLA
jgi:hypothetical protein